MTSIFDVDDDVFANFDPDQAIAAKRKSTATTPHQPPSKRPTITPEKPTSLVDTLERYFGYASFRGEQERVIQAVLDGRDVSVVWATGAGKSLVYQIPTLHTGKMAIIVSPLVSLMQDQVHKLNHLVHDDKELAAFLGSSQTDDMVQERVLAGLIPLVYITPEKLPSFLPRLERLQSQIGLFAIDEAHCVSEWGNDFRPDYRTVGERLRNGWSSSIPIVALTATATPRVQQDILQSLKLRNPVLSIGSADRTNLSLTVVRKRGGISTLLDVIDDTESTIVYARTRKEVEDIAALLQTKYAASVGAYHAGLSNRYETHTQFLTGAISIVVATVAFGMGIDKPDIRKVVHWGPPQTVEAYSQQVGRAGRDGLPAQGILYYSEADFDQYQSDFYVGKLSGEVKRATLESTQQLKSLAVDSSTCRRRQLLLYFETNPSLTECGMCDVCKARESFQDDMERDFGPAGAKVVLWAVSELKSQGLTAIVDVIGGKVLDDYRYKCSNYSPESLKKKLQEERNQMPKKQGLDYFRNLMSVLVQRGYVSEMSKSKRMDSFTRTWTVYDITMKGSTHLHQDLPIYLPVPTSVREMEKLEQERRQRVLDGLSKKGLPLDRIPEEEIKEGDGVVIRGYSKWYSYLESVQRSVNTERYEALQALLQSIQDWRKSTAVQLRLAPPSVLPEHLVAALAYATASLPSGMQIEKDSVMAAGVRTSQIDGLVQLLNGWADANRHLKPAQSAVVEKSDPKIVFTSQATKKWVHAVQSTKRTPAWVASYERFQKGESPQTIAIKPSPGKKPIQVATVVGHILDALVHGHLVDLARLAASSKTPTKKKWEEFRAAEMSSGIDVSGDPSKSGRNGERFGIYDFLRPIVGDTIVDKDRENRSDEEKALLSTWCESLKWYMALRRSGYEPSFESES